MILNPQTDLLDQACWMIYIYDFRKEFSSEMFMIFIASFLLVCNIGCPTELFSVSRRPQLWFIFEWQWKMHWPLGMGAGAQEGPLS